MAKFPSQRKIMYAGAAVSNGSFAQTHIVCLPKDLSLLNRRGYASTTRKGVPLVYRVAATVYPTGLDGSGYTTTVSSDVRTTVKYLGCQNNWVMKNAAVKFHAAREKMFRDAGVKKGHRGSYSHEIRYGYQAAADSFAAPVDGSGDAFTGGTWDVSSLSWGGDAGFGLTLVGNGDNEEGDAFSGSELSIGHSYLLSRVNQLADTNLESEEGPAKFSVLQSMLHEDLDTSVVADEVRTTARDGQDNPPYEVLDLSDSGDVSHDITEEVELGRSVMMPQGSGATMPQTAILDVPFGIFRVMMAHRDPGDNSGITDDLAVALEVLDIFEMQG
jgi:hypothetical protein